MKRKKQLNTKKKNDKNLSAKKGNPSNKDKAKYDEMRQIDWSYIDGPIDWN